MSLDDYDHHILRKYRLAAAIAVIRNKPNNSSLDNYLQHLKNNLNRVEMDIHDPEMTLCEEDFVFNDDDDCISNDTETAINYQYNDNQLNDSLMNGSQMNDSPMIDSQTTDIQRNDSQTILKGFDFNEMIINDKEDDNDKSNSVSDAIKILKGINDNGGRKTGKSQLFNIYHSSSTFYESSQSLPPTNCSINKLGETQNDNINNAITTVAEINYTKEATNTSIAENKAKCMPKDCQENIYGLEYTELTHLSESQFDNIVLPRNLIVAKRPIDNLKTFNITQKGIFKDIENSKNDNEFYLSYNKNYETGVVNNNHIVSLNTNEGRNFVNNASKRTVNKAYSEYKRKDIHSSRNVDKYEVNHTKCEETDTYNRNVSLNPGDRKNVVINTSHRAVNNIDNKNKEGMQNTDILLRKIVSTIVVPDNKKHKHDITDNLDNGNPKRSKINDNTDNMDYLSEIRSQFSDTEKNATTNERLDNCIIDSIFRNEGNIKKIKNNTRDVKLVNKNVCSENIGSETTKHLTAGGNEKNNEPNKDSQTSAKSIDNSQFLYFSQDLDNQDDNSNTFLDREINSDPIIFKDNTYVEINNDINENDQNVDLLEETLFDEITDSQKEVVPFKVLEELNKVKAFLNKRYRKLSTDCLSDSGYKSDSQSRGSFKSGRLIDRLHEEEKYPSFLEELLETVEKLLKQIYEEEIPDEKLLKKDEDIHRLFLLTKSSHIIRFTIEKIVAILEDIHTKLTEEELIEITHTVNTENLPYIFHVLETLIKKHTVCKNISSQCSTQPSQEDEVILKKSSITDIWRKKWNTKKSEVDVNVGSQKKCVLVTCSDVLNKIIVQAMDGYSLISFSALQCFNLLQN